MVTPAVRREAVAHLQVTYKVSERRACSVLGADRASMRYRGRRLAMRQRERGCVNWHSFAGDLAIAGFTSCSNAKASS